MSETLGQRLKRLREERGMTMYQVAQHTDLDPWVVSRLEKRVDLGNVQARLLVKLARFYGVTVDYLIGTWQEDAEPVKGQKCAAVLA